MNIAAKPCLNATREVKCTPLDRTDRKILDILQRNGRIAMTELAQQIGLSTSPCSERVKRMEREGVITGYHARVAPKALGKKLLVFVEITLAAKSGEVFDKVRKELLHVPDVQECHLVSGTFDYLVKARLSGMERIPQPAGGHPEEAAGDGAVAQLCGDGRTQGIAAAAHRPLNSSVFLVELRKLLIGRLPGCCPGLILTNSSALLGCGGAAMASNAATVTMSMLERLVQPGRARWDRRQHEQPPSRYARMARAPGGVRPNTRPVSNQLPASIH